MSNQSLDGPRRRVRSDRINSKREAGIRQKIWRLWVLVFSAGLAAAFASSTFATADNTPPAQPIETRPAAPN